MEDEPYEDDISAQEAPQIMEQVSVKNADSFGRDVLKRRRLKGRKSLTA
jgi:hypothetical protein